MFRQNLIMGYRRMLFAATLVSCASLGNGQPVSCLDDTHCDVGYFCETSLYVCHECLSCKDLKREPPLSPNSCIKSVRECGPCFDGLVPDLKGDINCVPPPDKTSVSASDDSNMTFVWIGAGISIVLLFIGAVALMYRFVCRHNWIKFNVDTNIGATLPTHVVASAPESPPPYSPPHPPGDTYTDEDTSRPLMKSYQPPFPSVESQDLQNVSVFNPPAYVRLNNDPRPPEAYNDVNDNYSAALHDEDTTPSPWVPQNNYTDSSAGASLNLPPSTNAQGQRGSGETNANASDFSAALAVARNTDLIQRPSVTLRLQSLNNNEESSSGDESSFPHHGGASARASRTASGNVNVMNVNQIFNIIKPPL